jgi:hypothetical protein
MGTRTDEPYSRGVQGNEKALALSYRMMRALTIFLFQRII